MVTHERHPHASIADLALEEIRDGFVVGLGSGRTAARFIEALAARVARGLKIVGVPTSVATERLARGLGIPLASLDDVGSIDVAVDGADEFDPDLNLIKGYGGALVREKIVAASARRLVIVAGGSKQVDRLGARGRLPVEVLPFALTPCRRRIAALGLGPELRADHDGPFVSDNGGYILDCSTGPIASAAELDAALRSIPGVIGTGLFLGMADRILLQDGDAARVFDSARDSRGFP
ncbi:MAG: ribose-5-phosphate isomerase RpiA [Isosphaeraceae bacterium]